MAKWTALSLTYVEASPLHTLQFTRRKSSKSFKFLFSGSPYGKLSLEPMQIWFNHLGGSEHLKRSSRSVCAQFPQLLFELIFNPSDRTTLWPWMPVSALSWHAQEAQNNNASPSASQQTHPFPASNVVKHYTKYHLLFATTRINFKQQMAFSSCWSSLYLNLVHIFPSSHYLPASSRTNVFLHTQAMAQQQQRTTLGSYCWVHPKCLPSHGSRPCRTKKEILCLRSLFLFEIMEGCSVLRGVTCKKGSWLRLCWTLHCFAAPSWRVSSFKRGCVLQLHKK